MQVNLSSEIIETIYNSLICSEKHLKSQLKSVKSEGKAEIIKSQLNDIQYALELWKELIGGI